MATEGRKCSGYRRPYRQQVISDELGLDLKETKSALGRARQVKVQKENTIIVGGKGDRRRSGRGSARSKPRSKTPLRFRREKLQERLAKLAGGVAVIQVGAATETEMKEKKLRIEDALAATKAAVEEGIVAGGGTAYVNAIPRVEALLDEVLGDEKTGVQIIEGPRAHQADRCKRRPRRICIVDKVRKSKIGVGFDVMKKNIPI